MIDWKRVETLRAEVGADEFSEVVEIFLDEVDELAEKLEGEDGPRHCEETMHSMKGAAVNLGFEALGRLSSAAEKQAKAGEVEGTKIEGVLVCYQQSKTVFIQEAKARGILN